MTLQTILRSMFIVALGVTLAACGNRTTNSVTTTANASQPGGYESNTPANAPTNYEKSSIWDVFGPNKGDQTVLVNRFLWNATLDVLNFLPVQSVDPFTGVIVMGYGTPPGGGRSYRATVHITDPALEARSLRVSLQSKGGPVSPATTRAVEDAILSRARQMRISDNKL